MSNIQYAYAVCGGEIVHISNANKTNNYFCFDCGTEMVARQGDIRVHHYAHQNNGSRCSGGGGEGVLHYNFKLLLYQYLNDMLYRSEPFNVSQHCGCGRMIKVNLLNGCNNVLLERNIIEGYRPDIILQTDSGDIIIELVHTHNISDFGQAHIDKEKITVMELYINEHMYDELQRKHINFVQDAINQNVDEWIVMRHHKEWYDMCPICAEQIKQWGGKLGRCEFYVDCNNCADCDDATDDYVCLDASQKERLRLCQGKYFKYRSNESRMGGFSDFSQRL